MKRTFTIILFISLGFGCGSKENKQEINDAENIVKTLPFLGEPVITFREENGVSFSDTVQHQIPAFSFTDQDGNIVTEKTVEGKVYVADFIFTTCPSICPIMTGNLKKVQDEFASRSDFMILSHSIDPDYDQPAVLRKYADEKGADTRIWKFLTGDRDSIYSICENQYMAFAQKDDKAPGGYIHSGFLVLIDKNRHIRGAYDGTEEGKTEDLIRDIRILLQE
ncbi:MAG: SCO family protein [Flavobacteriales bacterium]|nr:SCO family protein [Flavobacteriales bacterium]